MSCLERLVTKHLIKILLIVAGCGYAAATQIVQHGTYFLAGFSTDYTIVAIDSRETRADGQFNDQYCKIRPLSPKAFFFASGATSAIDNNTGANIFDARDLATTIYANIGPTRSSDLARTWAARMNNIYNAHTFDFAKLAASDGTMVKGFFIEGDQPGDIEAAGQVITYRALGFTNEQINIPFGHAGGTIPLFHNGHLEIMREFFDHGRTERAKKIIAQIGDKKGADVDATRYSAYVTAVRDWSYDPGIGGEIATIILERGKDWRWFKRPDFCPEQ